MNFKFLVFFSLLFLYTTLTSFKIQAMDRNYIKPSQDYLMDYLKQVEKGEGITPAESSFKLIELNEKRKKDHDLDMTNKLKALLTAKDISKSQRRALLTSKEHTEFVIDPKILDPLVQTYEVSNKNLKVENDSLRKDLAQHSDTLELMVKENQKLRQFLNQKDQDISKIISTISKQEGEVILSLKDNINIIEEENKYLVQKVEEMKQRLDLE